MDDWAVMSLCSDDPPHMRETADSSLRATERPLRIVFVAGALSGGGAERQLLQLATALHQLNHQVQYWCLIFT